MLRTIRQLWTVSRSHGLARSHVVRVFSRFAAVQLRSRASRKPIVVPFVNATRIIVGAGETGSNGNYYFGLHEFEDMAFLLHYLRPNDLFVDVGANVGSYTLLATGAVGARTIAFEPVPQTLTRLRANCDVNQIAAKVELRGICVGATNGTVAFSTDANTMNSIVANSSARSHINVPVRRLDSEITEAPAAIKIDAEGYDDDVLAGAGSILARNNPLALLVETLGGGAFGADRSSSEARLGQYGFVRCRYAPQRRALEQSSEAPAFNNLFVRDVEFARARVASAPRFDLNGFGAV